jgi:hypothetical protein
MMCSGFCQRTVISAVAMVLLGAFHSVAATQSIAVPAYFYPSFPDPLWTQMEDAAPTVAFAVLNPASGAGAAPDPNYVSQVAATRAAGVAVIGYVYSSYATRDAALLETDIDHYYEWYGVDGIFIDEASNNCADQPYYASLDDYVKAKGGTGLTVINPGTVTPECYAAAADILLNFEGSDESYQSWAPLGWEAGYDPSRFWHLVYGTAEAEMPAVVLQSQARGAGYVYVTPDLLPNPWDTLPGPTYWASELAMVQPLEGECPGALAKPKLLVRGVDSPEADDLLKLSGTFTLAGSPVIDPSVDGLRLVLGDASGAVADVTVPGGLYPGLAGSGWSGGGGKWTYRDVSDSPVGGIRSIAMKVVAGDVSTAVSLRVFGNDGSYPVAPASLPATAAVLLDPATPTELCAVATFPGPKPSCRVTGGGSGVRCK